MTKEEFLEAVGRTRAAWQRSKSAVEQTADFGAKGGSGRNKHEGAVALHGENIAKPVSC